MKAKLAELVTPIFSPEMGDRLRLVRMKMNLDQAQLGQFLGISQQQVSKIERGRIKTLENPFTLARFQAILSTHSAFVIWGTSPEKYPSSISTTYWKRRLARQKSGV